MESRPPDPPKTFKEFVERFPWIGEAWSKLADGSQQGPLSEREVRLVKLGIAVGAMREGAVHSAARKGPAAGLSREDMEQVVALSASTVGLPATVAAYTWVRDVVSAGISGQGDVPKS